MLLLASLVLSAAVLSEAENSGASVPALGIARRPVPQSEAMDFVRGMGVGWNLGNTFDAVKGDWNRNADEMTVETSWVGVRTNRAMFAALREAGFKTVRIPVSWHDHVSGDDPVISSRWLDRVQEVMDWALDEGLYVILNIHHDEENFLPSSACYEQSARYVGSIWAQLAERFASYGPCLIFESVNEPRLLGTKYEWNFDKNSAECRDAADCLNRLNQLFVDTVRASGGGNADRYLMVPGYDASPAGVTNGYFVLPSDSVQGRLMISVHAYTPYSFALQPGGTKSFGSQVQKSEIVSFMNSLYDQYVTKGIPVVIGEFGAVDRQGNLQDRVDFTAFYAATASARNMPCIWWDNGAFGGNGEIFGILDREKAEFVYPQIAQALLTYGGYDCLPDPQQ